MILITNEKINSFRPVWAKFHGFSLLFDNPGGSLKPLGKLKKVACELDAYPELSLYKALADAMKTLKPEELMRSCLFCTLPYDSYHVTMWDGINDGNISRVGTPNRKKLEMYLKGFPDGFPTSGKIIETIESSKLAIRPNWNIRFRFEKLAIWLNKALVACLAPADEISRDTLNQMLAERKKLNDRIGGLLDMDMKKSFKPHVSLGYFANPELADRFRKELEEMKNVFKAKTTGFSIMFESVSLYGFTDMATFFRK